MKKTHTLHRLLSLVLCICMVLSMVPGYALPVLAGEADHFCTCESDDPDWHAPFCALYAAPEDPECFCAEKCAEGNVNEWCEVCYFNMEECIGTDAAAVYEDTVISSGRFDEYSTGEVYASYTIYDTNGDSSGDKLVISGTGKTTSFSGNASIVTWDEKASTVTELIIEEGITEIQTQPFRDMENLTTVYLPNSLESIGAYAFYNCTSLTDIVFSDSPSLTTVKQSAFEYCTSLSDRDILEIPPLKTIGMYAFDETAYTTAILPPDIVSVGKVAFSSANLILYVPQSFITDKNNEISKLYYGILIGYELDTENKEATVTSMVTNYWDRFQNGVSLEVLFGCKITSVTENWHKRVPILCTEHLFENRVCKICKYSTMCGENCWWEFDAETGVLSIQGSGDMTDYSPAVEPEWLKQYKDQIKKVCFAEGITRVGNSTFRNAVNLETVEFAGAEVTKIGQQAFAGCISLKDIPLEQLTSLSEIRNTAFSGCTSLGDITLSADVLFNNVFSSCTGIRAAFNEGVRIAYVFDAPMMFYKTVNGKKIVAVPFADMLEIPDIEYFENEGVRTQPQDVIKIKDEYIQEYLFDGYTYGIDVDFEKFTYSTDTEINGAGSYILNLSYQYSSNTVLSGGGYEKYTKTIQIPFEVIAHVHTTDDRGQTCMGYFCTVCESWYGEADSDNHIAPYTADFRWPEEASEYMEVYVDLMCDSCGGEVDYFYAYGDAITVETVPGTDCKNPTVATCTLNYEYDGVTYTDTKTYIVPGDPHAGEFVNGFCSACGGFEEAVWNEEDYVYEIYNAGQLYWYAQELNTNNSEIYVKLMKDIVIPETAPNWKPINASYAYFNGNFHTISGLKCIGGDAQYVGLFGMEGWWYEISNLHIDSSYFEGSGYVGAVVACMTNGGSITNCAVTNTTVQGDGDSVGTLAGYLSVGSVVNCFVDTNTLVGGYTNGYATIENSYYLSETETEDGGKTAEQFASGEVAYLLQSGIAEEDIYDEDWNWIGSEQPHVWGQTVGQDAYPVLKGQKVYENLDCAGAVAGYANEIIIPEHSFVQGYCQVCGEPLGDAVLDGVTYVFGGVINGEWNLWSVEAPTYWVAGDGYAYFDPQGNVMTLDNVTLYLELWSSEEYGVSWEDDLVINFSGTNTLTTNDHNNGIVINVDGAAVMNGIGQNAVLNIISGADKAAQFESGLTVNSGTVSFVSQDSDSSSDGVSTVALTVAEGAVVNVTAGNANHENGLSYGLAAEKLHVDGTLNASYGFCLNERQPWSCGVICTELTGSGTINAVMMQLDQENMILSFTVRGKAVLASNWKATTDEGLTVTNIFTVAEGAILTIPEGVTLDLTGLPVENISIQGTILNNGTIICNHSVAEDDGDCTTDIPCLICQQPVIAGNDEHDWMDATCTTAKVCSFCGTTEGDALGHGTIEGFEYHQYSDYHEVWCTDCWDYSYQENHTYGEDHYCICGAPEMFTVTFMNGDEVWITDNRYYNTRIAYVGMNYPTKEGYSFSGWYTAEGDPIANDTLVMGDMVVHAGFRIKTYNYTVEVYTMDLFGNYGEPVVTTEAAEFGSIVDLTGYQTGEHFYLDGENINSKLYATVPANDDLVMRVYVVRKSYDITWILNGCTVVTGIGSDLPTYLRYSGDLGEDGWHYVKMLLDVPAGYRVADYVDGNGNSIAKESYNGHDRLKFYVTGDMTIEVVLEKETFDVTWIVDGTEFKETYEYGQVPVFTGSTDKANAGCAVYTFAGWNKDIVAVTCSASYTAIYNESFHHSWDDATCTEPKTCSACGTTEGEPLGHKWIYICNEPDTCSVCGATKDSVRQHTGYEDDGICDYCGMVAVEISLMDTDQRYFVFGQTGKDLVISVPENGHRLYYGAINRRTGENLAEGCVNRDGTFTIAGSLLDGMRMILVEVDPVYIFTVNVNGGSITDALKQALDAAGMQYTETYHERVYYIRYAGSLLYTGSYMREGFTLVGYELDGVRYGIDDPYVISGDDCVINLIWECNHNWTDATCTEPKTCTSCGETEGEALGHSYENNICTVCGSENVPVKLETAALSFQEKIHYNIFFSLNLSETVELADMGLVMFDSLNADGTVEDAIATYSGAVEMNGMYMVATDGVHAKCMGDTIYFRAYAKLADGSYVYSKTVEYSAVTYADHILNGDYSDNDKALVAAMLNYGAQAQLYFDYNSENLANANLTAEQKALVKDYASDLLAPVQKLDSSKTGVFASTGTGFAKKAPAVSFEGSFLLNYFFTPSETVAGDMTLYYWTEADYAAATELTAENATGSIVMTPGAQYHAVLDGIYAKDADATVYVAAVYSDGTATHCTGVLPYSIGAYLTSHAAKETNFRAMAQAAAVYCSYCKEYFKG